jgi:hypothetical protein
MKNKNIYIYISEMHFLRSPNNIELLHNFIIYSDSKKTRDSYNNYN